MQRVRPERGVSNQVGRTGHRGTTRRRMNSSSLGLSLRFDCHRLDALAVVVQVQVLYRYCPLPPIPSPVRGSLP